MCKSPHTYLAVSLLTVHSWSSLFPFSLSLSSCCVSVSTPSSYVCTLSCGSTLKPTDFTLTIPPHRSSYHPSFSHYFPLASLILSLCYCTHAMGILSLTLCLPVLPSFRLPHPHDSSLPAVCPTHMTPPSLLFAPPT